MGVLGPRSVNDSKFSPWCTTLDVLGLEFNTIDRTVTMPKEKLVKASARVCALHRSSTMSRHELECLLGRLWHVTCILRSAKAFFQRVQTACKRMPSRGCLPVSEVVRLDLQWFHFILEHGAWTGLPTSMFNEDPEIDVHWYMDASDHGLAVADPARKRFVQLKFDDHERDMICGAKDGHLFNINVRELF